MRVAVVGIAVVIVVVVVVVVVVARSHPTFEHLMSCDNIASVFSSSPLSLFPWLRSLRSWTSISIVSLLFKLLLKKIHLQHQRWLSQNVC